eukprot:COSAG05_NODE_1363_length_5081_cov_1.577479_9_plen_36_part_01
MLQYVVAAVAAGGLGRGGLAAGRDLPAAVRAVPRHL